MRLLGQMFAGAIFARDEVLGAGQRAFYVRLCLEILRDFGDEVFRG